MNTAVKDVHYTPPSSPNMGHVQTIVKSSLKAFSAGNFLDVTFFTICQLMFEIISI